MKRIFTVTIAAAALAAAAAIPAKATTFPALTTIYVASGAVDNVTATDLGISTVINCTNMSGQTASVRYQFRANNGTPLAGATLLLGTLATQNVTTVGGVNWLFATALPTPEFSAGSIQVLSTQSAVYCSAMLVRAELEVGPAGVDLHMVRFNPHPGTVE